MKCPVCSTENKVFEDHMTDPPVGVCEHYYYCNNCGYIEHMAYSPTYCGFDGPWYAISIKMWFARLKNFKKFIKVLKDDHYANWVYRV